MTSDLSALSLLRNLSALPSACEVSFDNVPVPVENVIGEVGGGFKVRLSRLCLRCEVFLQMSFFMWTDCHEHPELGQVQYGQQCVWDDQETDRYNNPTQSSFTGWSRFPLTHFHRVFCRVVLGIRCDQEAVHQKPV